MRRSALRPLDLIETAHRLSISGGHRPRQADLRRAVSTAYYAMFHLLAKTCADGMLGGVNASRSNRAWRQVYRALEHGSAKNACKNHHTLKLFPKDIEDFANT